MTSLVERVVQSVSQFLSFLRGRTPERHPRSPIERFEQSVSQFFSFFRGQTPERHPHSLVERVEHFLLNIFNIKPKKDVTVTLSEMEYVDLLIWILIIFGVLILIGVVRIIIEYLVKKILLTKISNISIKYVKHNILIIGCDPLDHCNRFIPESACDAIQSAILMISNNASKRDEKTPAIIVIVHNVRQCNDIVRVLRSHCEEYPVLGFDCEWTHVVYDARDPVCLLQLATHTGLCVLFRLCNIGIIPKSLKELLEDDKIIKVGVALDRDAKHLEEDYLTFLSGILELNRIREVAGEPVLRQPMGLKRLSKKYLNIELDKDKSTTLSNWVQSKLSKDQIKYAAYDAFVGIELFKYFAKRISPNLEESLTSCSKHIIKFGFEQFTGHSVIEFQMQVRSGKTKTPFNKQNIDLHFEKRYPLRCFEFNINNLSRTVVSHDRARQYLESREAVLMSPCAIQIIPIGSIPEHPFVSKLNQ